MIAFGWFNSELFLKLHTLLTASCLQPPLAVVKTVSFTLQVWVNAGEPLDDEELEEAIVEPDEEEPLLEVVDVDPEEVLEELDAMAVPDELEEVDDIVVPEELDEDELEEIIVEPDEDDDELL